MLVLYGLEELLLAQLPELHRCCLQAMHPQLPSQNESLRTHQSLSLSLHRMFSMLSWGIVPRMQHGILLTKYNKSMLKMPGGLHIVFVGCQLLNMWYIILPGIKCMSSLRRELWSLFGQQQLYWMFCGLCWYRGNMCFLPWFLRAMWERWYDCYLYPVLIKVFPVARQQLHSLSKRMCNLPIKFHLPDLRSFEHVLQHNNLIMPKVSPSLQ